MKISIAIFTLTAVLAGNSFRASAQDARLLYP